MTQRRFDGTGLKPQELPACTLPQAQVKTQRPPTCPVHDLMLFRDAAFGSVPRERVTSKCFIDEWLPINLQVVVQEPLVYLPVYGEASDGWVVMFLPFQQR